MTGIELKSTDISVRGIVRAAFPSYKRRKVIIREFSGPKNVNSYWDEGSKDEYRLVDLTSQRSIPFPTTHPFFDRKQDGERCGNLEITDLPMNWCLVKGGYFCGKERYLTLFFHPDNLAKLLPNKLDLKIKNQEDKIAKIKQKIANKEGKFVNDDFRGKRGHYTLTREIEYLKEELKVEQSILFQMKDI